MADHLHAADGAVVRLVGPVQRGAIELLDIRPGRGAGRPGERLGRRESERDTRAANVAGRVDDVWHMVEYPLDDGLIGRTTGKLDVKFDVFVWRPLGGIGEGAHRQHLDRLRECGRTEAAHLAHEARLDIRRTRHHVDVVLFVADQWLGSDEDAALWPAAVSR